MLLTCAPKLYCLSHSILSLHLLVFCSFTILQNITCFLHLLHFLHICSAILCRLVLFQIDGAVLNGRARKRKKYDLPNHRSNTMSFYFLTAKTGEVSYVVEMNVFMMGIYFHFYCLTGIFDCSNVGFKCKYTVLTYLDCKTISIFTEHFRHELKIQRFSVVIVSYELW